MARAAVEVDEVANSNTGDLDMARGLKDSKGRNNPGAAKAKALAAKNKAKKGKGGGSGGGGGG